MRAYRAAKTFENTVFAIASRLANYLQVLTRLQPMKFCSYTIRQCDLGVAKPAVSIYMRVYTHSSQMTLTASRLKASLACLILAIMLKCMCTHAIGYNHDQKLLMFLYDLLYLKLQLPARLHKEFSFCVDVYSYRTMAQGLCLIKL